MTKGHGVSKKWLEKYDEFKKTKFHSIKKLDSKKLSMVKFFVHENIPVISLNSIHLHAMADAKLGRHAFVNRILPDMVKHMNTEIASRLQQARYVNMITDIWTTQTMADFIALGAILAYDTIRREIGVLGMERMDGPHTADNINFFEIKLKIYFFEI
jgi:hypothetical protein